MITKVDFFEGNFIKRYYRKAGMTGALIMIFFWVVASAWGVAALVAEKYRH